jgi:5'-nucleotidase
MKILIVNDDGFKSLGIQTLAKILHSQGHNITIVAPATEQSCRSHAMSCYGSVSVKLETTGLPFPVYSVGGFPADSTMVGLEFILKDNPPDVVVSGINHGFNAGQDANGSGTVGAATQAAFMGFKTIGCSSQVYGASMEKDVELCTKIFTETAQCVAKIIANIHLLTWPKNQILNLNYPYPCTEIHWAAMCPDSMYYYTVTSNKSVEVLATHVFENEQQSCEVYIDAFVKPTSQYTPTDDALCLVNGIATLAFIQPKQSNPQTDSLDNLLKILNENT